MRCVDSQSELQCVFCYVYARARRRHGVRGRCRGIWGVLKILFNFANEVVSLRVSVLEYAPSRLAAHTGLGAGAADCVACTCFIISRAAQRGARPIQTCHRWRWQGPAGRHGRQRLRVLFVLLVLLVFLLDGVGIHVDLPIAASAG